MHAQYITNTRHTYGRISDTSEVFFTNYTSVYNATYLFSSPSLVHNKLRPCMAIIRCSFAKNCFTVSYIPLLASHMNATYPNLKLRSILKPIKINKIYLKFRLHFSIFCLGAVVALFRHHCEDFFFNTWAAAWVFMCM
jgi:hypothetical protein